MKKIALAEAQRKCLGLPPDAPAGLRFSAVHWHPQYASNHPKGMGRLPVLLEPKEAAKYGMVTVWNKVSTQYDGTPKVLAIPNYLGVIRGSHAYDDVRLRAAPPGSTLRTARPTTWSLPSPGEGLGVRARGKVHVCSLSQYPDTLFSQFTEPQSVAPPKQSVAPPKLQSNVPDPRPTVSKPRPTVPITPVLQRQGEKHHTNTFTHTTSS